MNIRVKEIDMFDVIVIGAGPAGYEVALLLAKDNKKVCIVDKSENQIGGTCLNEGCIPAKNFLETASYIKKSAYFRTCGVDISINSFDIEKLKDNTNILINESKQGILLKLKNAGVEIKYGTASFVTPNSIRVEKEVLNADEFIIATGSSHRNHPVLPLIENKIISSKEVFELKEIPKSILIVGGGAIGCEFATFFNALGSTVEIAEFTPSLVPVEDDDIARTLKRELEKQGIKVNLKTNVIWYEIVNDGIKITLDVKGKEEIKIYDKVLISIGRTPNTKDLDLDVELPK
mgnify:CR=1 FL=1